MKQIGKNIRKHRIHRGMTQEQLADKVNVTRQAVSSWETGKTQPGIEMLSAIAAQFDIPVEELIYSRVPQITIAAANEAGTGVIFGALFLMLMTMFLLFAEALFSNAWWLLIAVSLTLSGLITVLIKQADRIDALAARIEQLEKAKK